MWTMEASNEEIRHILHFYFLKGGNASKGSKKIFDVYGADTLSVLVGQQWFDRFFPYSILPSDQLELLKLGIKQKRPSLVTKRQQGIIKTTQGLTNLL
uniref:Histonelysine Nmethyltransferase SETMARlike [Ceratitis capitata] n=1 Tax=Lepeophtheirus salmonis TaxID=72036 RepID=A0A0K2TFA1_LEPSM